MGCFLGVAPDSTARVCGRRELESGCTCGSVVRVLLVACVLPTRLWSADDVPAVAAVFSVVGRLERYDVGGALRDRELPLGRAPGELKVRPRFPLSSFVSIRKPDRDVELGGVRCVESVTVLRSKVDWAENPDRSTRDCDDVGADRSVAGDRVSRGALPGLGTSCPPAALEVCALTSGCRRSSAFSESVRPTVSAAWRSML